MGDVIMPFSRSSLPSSLRLWDGHITWLGWGPSLLGELIFGVDSTHLHSITSKIKSKLRLSLSIVSVEL
eukprot:scaffold19785_cov50-Skeletonema_dohrnii-CCMP3373.AAC.2